MVSNKLEMFTPELTNKRIFYNPNRFLAFLHKNEKKIENVKIKPAQLGKKGFGIFEVEVKDWIINE